MSDETKKLFDDGGPAFGHGSNNGHCCGATLWDYYAAAALAGNLANPSSGGNRGEYASDAAFQSDVMLAERKRRFG